MCPTRFHLAPGSDAVTCSPSCATRLGNLNRSPRNCRHCRGVDDYRWTRDADRRAMEVACGDEEAPVMTFRTYLTDRRMLTA